MRFRLKSGRALGYRTRGIGPVVVLLHPVGLSSAFWLPVMDALQQEFRLIAIDFPGHGDSDASAERLSLRQMGADVAEAATALAETPFVVAGCSLGGMVAVALAQDAPSLVRGLVVSNAGVGDAPGRGDILRARADKARQGMPAVADQTIERWFNPRFQASHREIVDEVKHTLLDDDPVVHARMWEAMAEMDLAARMAEIDVPALVTVGSDDRSVSMAAFDATADLIRGARRHVFEESGHLTPLEDPAGYAAVLRAFAVSL